MQSKSQGRRNPRRFVPDTFLEEQTGIPAQQWRTARCTRRGVLATLPFYKVGARVRYDLDEFYAWWEQHRREPAS